MQESPTRNESRVLVVAVGGVVQKQHHLSVSNVLQ